MKTAYFAGGCFWCITPVFTQIPGVLSVTSGYCGGDEASPSYEDVKSQTTGHRETVKIDYDESRLSYPELLDVFFRNVDITDGGGQFIDRGRSYTLAIYYTSDEEKAAADAKINALGCKDTVSVEAYKSFYDAEEYHQNFYLKKPERFKEEIKVSGRKNI